MSMWRFWFALAVAWSSAASALPLQTIGTFCGLYPDQCRKGTESLLAARGIGTDAYYVIEVDPTTGALPVDASGGGAISVTQGTTPWITKEDGHSYVTSARNDYSLVNVTTGAWVELIASTASATNGITLFDSSGQTLELGAGAASSENRILIIPPGGIDGFLRLEIPSGTRVSVRAISGTANSGEIDLTLLN